jgi:hypothetical protein
MHECFSLVLVLFSFLLAPVSCFLALCFSFPHTNIIIIDLNEKNRKYSGCGRFQ